MSAALPLDEAAGLRQVAYRLLALLLLDPERQRWQRLVRTANALRAFDDRSAALGFFVACRRLLDAIDDAGSSDLAALRVEHTRLFTIDPERMGCPPYESFYTAADALSGEWVAAQLVHTYRAAGLDIAPALNERPDHAAVELEFMAYLCGQEAAAWEQAAYEVGVRVLRQEQTFLTAHLSRWIGDLTRRICAATREPLYAAVAAALEAFVQHDRDLVGAIAPEAARLARRAGATGPNEAAPAMARPS